MYIKPTRDAMSLWDFDEDIASNALLSENPSAETPPIPWDADIEVQGGKVIITGSLAPGGPLGAKCVCECPIDMFPKLYSLWIPDYADLKGSGWVEV